jgi:rubredoxin
MSDSETSWKCSNCGYTLVQAAPPDKCPACGQECEFINVTCYIPECGAEAGARIDPRLKGDKEIK